MGAALAPKPRPLPVGEHFCCQTSIVSKPSRQPGCFCEVPCFSISKGSRHDPDRKTPTCKPGAEDPRLHVPPNRLQGVPKGGLPASLVGQLAERLSATQPYHVRVPTPAPAVVAVWGAPGEGSRPLTHHTHTPGPAPS